MTISYTTFDSTHSGNHLVIFGAVHGNEYCGPQAIQRIITALQDNTITLKTGRITLVPVCNPQAYLQQTRFVDRNLNRHFYPKETYQYYEDRLNPILCNILDDADYLLDLHSYQSQGGPFAFLGTSSQAELDYSEALGLPLYVYGWGKAFGSANATEEQKRASLGTTDYVRNKAQSGCAITVECGHHHNKNAVDIAYQTIIRAMQHTGLTGGDTITAPSARAVQMKHVYYKQHDGAFSKAWQHGDIVQKGEMIAEYTNGDALTAPEDAVMVLPKTATDHAIGSEWFYLGVETEFPTPDK